MRNGKNAYYNLANPRAEDVFLHKNFKGDREGGFDIAIIYI